MALVPNCSPDLRVYKLSFAPGFPSPEEESESRSNLLHKIQTFNHRAMDRLDSSRPKRRCRAVAADCFTCFGLLDPVSNVILNNLISWKWKQGRPRREHGYLDHASRSLDGLVTFLTRLFPNLAESQAVRYLLLADADILVAARIVVSHIGMKGFDESGPAAMEALNMALKCAAIAAGHPDPDRLVDGWHSIPNHVDEVRRLLGLLRGRFHSSSVGKLSRLLREPPVHDGGCGDMWRAWQLASRVSPSRCEVPFRHTSLMIRTLQDAIHWFYLQALARLPAGELRSRFHRSPLRARHCYGPFDPVSNIIINTIWYDATFPRTHELEQDVIDTLILHRMENRSLYGMASFLSTRFHRVSFRRALRCLLEADCNLLRGSELLGDHAQGQGPANASVEEAYLAAATAALHPNPDAQVKLLACCNKAMLGSALSLLQGCDKLSSEDVQQLAVLLSPESSGYCGKPLPLLPLTGYPRAQVAYAHTRITNKVKAVLNSYEQMPNGDPTFELHTICGVNEYVSGPVGTRLKCHHMHVNFLVTSTSPNAEAPMLFFAEISTNDYDTSFCCPLSLPLPFAAQTRCLYCEFNGLRIVHPVGIDFHGRELEFEKMAHREEPCDDVLLPTQRYYSNLRIINNRCLVSDSVRGRLKEDSLYDDVDGDKRERIMSSKIIGPADALHLYPVY